VLGGLLPRPLVSFCQIVLILAFPTLLKAQVRNPTVAATAPIPGAGHNYIGVASETVNPVDGSFSFNLPMNSPPGRQLNFQFGMRYGSYEQFNVASNGESPAATWERVPVARSSSTDGRTFCQATPRRST
jgi:hypothetical protein